MENKEDIRGNNINKSVAKSTYFVAKENNSVSKKIEFLATKATKATNSVAPYTFDIN